MNDAQRELHAEALENIPAHLTDAQREIYAATLADIPGDLNPAKLRLLEAFSIERARMLEAEAYLNEHGPTLTLRSDKGTPIKIMEAPQLKIAAAAQDRSLRLASQLRI